MSLLDIDGSKTMTSQGVEFTLDNWLPDAVSSSKYWLPRNQSDHCILGDLGDVRNILMATLSTTGYSRSFKDGSKSNECLVHWGCFQWFCCIFLAVSPRTQGFSIKGSKPKYLGWTWNIGPRKTLSTQTLFLTIIFIICLKQIRNNLYSSSFESSSTTTWRLYFVPQSQVINLVKSSRLKSPNGQQPQKVED